MFIQLYILLHILSMIIFIIQAFYTFDSIIFYTSEYNYEPDCVYTKLAAPISNGGLILAPPGHFTGSIQRRVGFRTSSLPVAS